MYCLAIRRNTLLAVRAVIILYLQNQTFPTSFCGKYGVCEYMISREIEVLSALGVYPESHLFQMREGHALNGFGTTEIYTGHNVLHNWFMIVPMVHWQALYLHERAMCSKLIISIIVSNKCSMRDNELAKNISNTLPYHFLKSVYRGAWKTIMIFDYRPICKLIRTNATFH